MIPRELLQRIRQIEIVAKRKVTSRFSGGYLSTFRGQGMEFDEVRAYQPGDDIRQIDWNVTARAGQPFIKRFVVEREMTVLLVVDVSGSLLFGSGERSKGQLLTELCTLLAFLAIGNGDRVGLLLVSDRIEHLIRPGKGKKHLYRVIRELLSHEPQSTGTDLPCGLDFANHIMPRHSTVFLVSDFLLSEDGNGLERAVGKLARRHDVIAISMSDPHEQALPDVGLLEVVDPETGASGILDSSDPLVREAFARQSRSRRDALWQMLACHGVDRVPLHTHVSYMKPLMRFFATRTRRLR